MILPEDFSLERYGLSVRFVNVEDAEFILKLRTDPVKGRYIGRTDDTIFSQVNWIKNYKNREKLGEDYYFFYSFKGKPAGVNRIYNIHGTTFIHGSWIFSNEVPPFCSLAAAVIAREIAYEELNLTLEEDISGIHEDNSSVLEVSRILGVEFTGVRKSEEGDFLTGRLTKEAFENNKSKLLRIIPKKYM